jgi:hypothetical protein
LPLFCQGLTDRKDSVLELLAALGEKGIRHVGFDPLNPYPAVIERLRGTHTVATFQTNWLYWRSSSSNPKPQARDGEAFPKNDGGR